MGNKFVNPSLIHEIYLWTRGPQALMMPQGEQ